jgi:pyridoxine 4-dehydrogenase
VCRLRIRWANSFGSNRRGKSDISAFPTRALTSFAGRRVATIVSVQNRYNIGDRADDEIVNICARERMAFIPWAPLGSGRLAATARKHNATPAQVALAWLLARSPAMLPIPGTSSIAHFDENMQAANIRLSESELREIALG